VIELVDAFLDVLSQALELDAIKLHLVTIGVEGAGDEIVGSGVVAGFDGALDEIMQFRREVDGELTHGVEGMSQLLNGQDASCSATGLLLEHLITLVPAADEVGQQIEEFVLIQ